MIDRRGMIAVERERERQLWLREHVQSLESPRPLEVGGLAVLLDPDADFETVVVLSRTEDGAYIVARKRAPTNPLSHQFLPTELVEVHDFIEAERESKKVFPDAEASFEGVETPRQFLR